MASARELQSLKAKLAASHAKIALNKKRIEEHEAKIKTTTETSVAKTNKPVLAPLWELSEKAMKRVIETKEGDALEGFLGSLPFGLRGVLRETVGLSPAAAVLAVLLFTIVAAYILVLQFSGRIQVAIGRAMIGFAAFHSLQLVICNRSGSPMSVAVAFCCLTLAVYLAAMKPKAPVHLPMQLKEDDLGAKLVQLAGLAAWLPVAVIFVINTGVLDNVDFQDFESWLRDTLTLEQAIELEENRWKAVNAGESATRRDIEQQLNLDFRAAEEWLAKLKGKEVVLDIAALSTPNRIRYQETLVKLAMHDVRKAQDGIAQAHRTKDLLLLNLGETKLAAEREALAKYKKALAEVEHESQITAYLANTLLSVGSLIVAYLVLSPSQSPPTEYIFWGFALILTMLFVSQRDGHEMEDETYWATNLGGTQPKEEEKKAEGTKEDRAKDEGGKDEEKKAVENKQEQKTTTDTSPPKLELLPTGTDGARGMASHSAADYLGMYHLSLLSPKEFETMKSRVAELHQTVSGNATVQKSAPEKITAASSSSTKTTDTKPAEAGGKKRPTEQETLNIKTEYETAATALKNAERAGNQKDIDEAKAKKRKVEAQYEQICESEDRARKDEKAKLEAERQKIATEQAQIELDEAKKSLDDDRIKRAKAKLDAARGTVDRSQSRADTRAAIIERYKQDHARLQLQAQTDAGMSNTEWAAIAGTALAGPIGTVVGGLAGTVVDHHVRRTLRMHNAEASP